MKSDSELSVRASAASQHRAGGASPPSPVPGLGPVGRSSTDAGATRASVYSAKSFTAFRVSDGKHTIPLALSGAPRTLDDALAAAMVRTFHKDQLVIRETDEETGKVALHLYAIRRRAPQWIHQPGDILPKRVADHYADPLCSIDGSVLLAGTVHA